MSDAPEPAAAIYTTVSPSGVFKLGSVSEGFVCSGIWAALSIILVTFLMLWTFRAHPEGALAADWNGFVGKTVGQFLVMAVFLSAIVFFRRGKNFRSFIFLDWRCRLVCFIHIANPPNPDLALLS